MSNGIVIGLVGKRLNFIEAKLLSYQRIAGVILFERNYQTLSQLKCLIDSIQKIRRTHNLLNVLILLDHEGGAVQRLKKDEFTVLPSAKLVGEFFQRNRDAGKQLIRSIACVTAIELGAAGIDIILGPVMDLAPTKEIMVRHSRYYSADPDLVAEMAWCYIKELQQYGLIAAPKHFPGIVGGFLDSHWRVALSSKNMAQLLSEDLLPYQYLVKESMLHMLMLSHHIYWKIDSCPISDSSIWLNDILRKHMGFQGLVMTDCMQMRGAGVHCSTLREQIMVSSEAGVDLMLYSHPSTEVYQELYTEVKCQVLDQDILFQLQQIFALKLDCYSELKHSDAYLSARERVTYFNQGILEKSTQLKIKKQLYISRVLKKQQIKRLLQRLIRGDYYLRLYGSKAKSFLKDFFSWCQ